VEREHAHRPPPPQEQGTRHQPPVRDLLIELQRSAGNSAVSDRLAALQRDAVEVDLEVAPPAERERLRRQGIQLPAVSAQAADPRGHSRYIDGRVRAVGFGIYLGGYLVYVDGVGLPVFVPESHLDFAGLPVSAPELAVLPDRESALGELSRTGPVPRGTTPIGYYWGAGGAVIAPTTFSSQSTPNLVRTALAARSELAAQVQRELAVMAIGIVGGMLFRAVINRLLRVGGGRYTPPAPRLSGPAQQARTLANRLRQQGKPVIANIGGAGSAHEPPHAININNQAVARRGIPNHVHADGTDIGQLFDAGSVDQVVGYRMPPSVVDWNRAVPGIRQVLAPGGTFRYSYQGANADARLLEQALRRNGFRNVTNTSDVLVEAVRP
jgi:stage V sporulation protein SpoVS